MVKSHAKTVEFLFTANSPSTQVSPRMGSRTAVATMSVLNGIKIDIILNYSVHT